MTTEGMATRLDGSGSSSFPFEIREWEWDIGYTGTFEADIVGKIVDWAFQADGEYQVALRVDDGVFTGIAVITVTVLDGAPEAIIDTSVPLAIIEDEVLVLEGRFTSQIDEVILQEWDFGDGNKATGASVSHSWARKGVYNVTYTVLDSDGSEGVQHFEIVILNKEPKAGITVESMEVLKGESVFLDGSSTNETPTDMSFLNFSWDFGDGTTGAGAQVSHVYTASGTYKVSLTVTDDDGASNWTTVDLTIINRPPTIPPFRDFRFNDTDPAASIRLSDLITDPDDPEGDWIVTIPEYEPGGPFNVRLEDHPVRGWVLTIDPVEGREGRFRVDITVDDGDGGRAETSFNVTIVRTSDGIDWTSPMFYYIVLAIMVAVMATVALNLYFKRVRRERSD
jgi:PKD repeat protein